MREKGGVKGWMGEKYSKERRTFEAHLAGRHILMAYQCQRGVEGGAPYFLSPPFIHFIFVRKKGGRWEREREKDSLPFSPKCFYASKCLLKF